MKRKYLEDIESELFATWLRQHGYKFTHIPNESGLPARVAMLVAIKKKRMGVSPGAPDFLIILKRKALLFIELKKNRTRKDNWEYYALSTDWIEVRPEQERWIEQLNELDNIGAFFAFWSKEAIEIVRREENK